MLVSVTASVHLVAGTDKQRILVFRHAETAVFKRGNGISAEDTDRSFAFPAFIILYDPYDLYRIVFLGVILSKDKKIVIFARVKSTEFWKLRFDYFFTGKRIVRCV